MPTIADATTMPIPERDDAVKKPGLAKRILRLAALAVLAGGAGGGAWIAAIVWDLPTFEHLLDYKPKEATRVLGADGSLVAVLAEERRTVVPPEEIPEVLRKAIISAEDAGFYQHEGVSYSGIARAFVKNLASGETRQGASTITQQVVKTFLLSPERTYQRKIRELVLAKRLEENLSKDEILYLYLNQIYFGHRRYGVEEASRYFFGKGVKDLGLAEAALLAGLPQSPARLSPFAHPERAKARQTYVLGRMLDNGFITRAEHDREVARPLPLAPRPEALPGPYYGEVVRQVLLERYGEEVVMTGGLTVTIAMDPRLQRAADRAVEDALVAYDRRHGYRGTLGAPDPAMVAKAAKDLAEERADAPERAFVGDVKAGRAREATPGVVVAGVVETVGPKEATIDLAGVKAKLPASEARWAGKSLPETLRAGEVALVEVKRVAKGEVTVGLFQEPEVEGALVALDPASRRVRALVGGRSFQTSKFNRATQAKRQPGSAFKPFVYGAAIESGRWTAASLVSDAPETFRDPWTGKDWKPQNYDRAFEGTISLRRAVAMSKNTVPVRIVSELGVDAVIDFARRAGIAGDLPKSHTLALGTGEVTPLELASAYATLAGGGLAGEPVFVERVVARDGRVLEEAADEARATITPAVAYVVTDLLRGVVEEGTGRAAADLARPAAGKTGTTSDGTDAWFAGYTPDLVAVSWVGFDDARRKLGRGEAGGRTALPAWIDLMREAHSGKPIRAFEPPAGVDVAAIDPATGLLAAEGAPALELPFLPGTAPTAQAIAPGVSAEDTPADLFLEEEEPR